MPDPTPTDAKGEDGASIGWTAPPGTTEPQVLLVTLSPWYSRTAFKAWVKNSFSTLAGVPIVDVTGLVGWRQALIVSGVLIVKDLIGSMYEIIYGKDAEGFRRT